MGTGTFVNERPYAERPNNPAVRRGVRGFDMPLLVSVVALIVFGLAMLFSASWDFSLSAYGDAMHMFNRQLMWLSLGLIVAVCLAFFDYHHWRRFVVPAMALTVMLLMTVLLMNEIRFGAKRAFFDGSVQPSELAKLVTIIYLSPQVPGHGARGGPHPLGLGLAEQPNPGAGGHHHRHTGLQRARQRVVPRQSKVCGSVHHTAH